MESSKFALYQSLEEKIKAAVCLWLLVLVAVFVTVSFHWPMVGDVTFMHYVVFLMKHGMVPYRDIVDMNLPASYLLEAAAMRLPGSEAVAWRLYDFLLVGMASVALMIVLRRAGWLAGVLAAALFVLIHGQDGTIMAGERDLAGAVLLLIGVAFLFVACSKSLVPRGRSLCLLCCGLSLGSAACIKPTLVSALVCALGWSAWQSRRKLKDWLRTAGQLLFGAALPFLATVAFLVRAHALTSFLGEVSGLLPDHAMIDERPLGYLLAHCFAPLLPLLILWIVATYLLRGEWANSERLALLLFALCGLLSYVLQGKGFSYQRYPFVAFLLPLIVGDLASLLAADRLRRLVGLTGVGVAVLLASQCAFRLTKFQRTPAAQPLLRDLSSLGSPENLSGHVQCMDTIGSCIDNLYAARIVQSTGFLYDCYLLGGQGSAKEAWVTEELRKRFWKQMERNTPQLIVVTDSICYQQTASFDKYGQWPEFTRYLAANYALVRQSEPQVPVHYWSRSSVPFGYRIYERRQDLAAVSNLRAR